jgi:hypothetical protein
MQHVKTAKDTLLLTLAMWPWRMKIIYLMNDYTDNFILKINFCIQSHGNHNGIFSSVGIKLVVDYFKNKGHKDIKAFVPRFRENHANTKNPEILKALEKEGILIFTPSRSYDDGFILETAKLKNAVIVSNDNYKDKIFEEEYREITEKKQVYLEIIFFVACKWKSFIYTFTIFILVL